jgi:hypothetical protein
LEFDERTYLSLINNYDNLGWHNDANKCYYNYRNAVRRNWLKSRAQPILIKISNIANWFIDTTEMLLYGYGVRPLFTIIWSSIIVLAFGIFFSKNNSLLKLISEKCIIESKDKPDEAIINIIKRKSQIRYFDPFLFSLLIFSSGFTIFIQPSVEYELQHHTRWIIVERLLGTFFVALFLTSISKTYLIR